MLQVVSSAFPDIKKPSEDNNMRDRIRSYVLIIALVIALAPLEVFAETQEDEPVFKDNQKIYVKLVEHVKDSVDLAASKISNALKANGWEIAGTFYASVPENCKYKTKVLIIHNEHYWQQIYGVSPYAKFVYPLKVNIYSDETGTNISVTNPVALNRLISPELEAVSAETLKTLAGLFHGAVKGNNIEKEEGTELDGNRIPGLGGGALEDNVIKIYTGKYKSDKVLETITKFIQYSLKRSTKGYYLVYSIDMRDKGIMFFGVSKQDLEKKAFTITGEKRVTNKNSCPGIDHANAFPLEVVIDTTGKNIKEEMLRVMFKMKTYFGDTGEAAFVKHYMMPGSIEDEIVYTTYPDIYQQ
ncbi:MAG: hypothetical protein HQK97_04780 [Nitrospirae bacterium]|nr:hypothetical protein [Nitrospirota bacterium]